MSNDHYLYIDVQVPRPTHRVAVVLTPQPNPRQATAYLMREITAALGGDVEWEAVDGDQWQDAVRRLARRGDAT
jgi:hypothetical protein